MKIGTKSVLFGVHQFLWHPWTVARAWRFMYQKWPDLTTWCAIICHDLGYWGKPEMDGPQGKTHPKAGAVLAAAMAYAAWKMWLAVSTSFDSRVIDALAELESKRAFSTAVLHSASYATLSGKEPGVLCGPDKVSIFFDPQWFYLLRATLSGEIKEFIADHEAKQGFRFSSKAEWFQWYRLKVGEKWLLTSAGK